MFGLTPYRKGRRDLDVIRDPWDFDKMFDSMLESFYSDSGFPKYFPMDNSGIRVDISENDKEYILEAELPGVSKEDIKLELKDDVLTISAEKKEEVEEKKENYIRRERRFGSMSRSFYVDDVDADNVKAKFEDGILIVKLPKVEPSSPKNNQIPIE
ncbi:MAG: HSP20 family protein [Sporanaerobacter sp.]|jgi:HSP20 family protein|uniref:Hsp20/alpha crystallin family protein n=1 Tax=Sporanaerobacter sp. TaxID=2010183 RepID=UPI003A1034D4